MSCAEAQSCTCGHALSVPWGGWSTSVQGAGLDRRELGGSWSPCAQGEQLMAPVCTQSCP